VRKVEQLYVFPACTADDMGKAYNEWIVKRTEEREKNVAVNSVPFYQDIVSRDIIAVGPSKVCLAVFYHDYLLTDQEKGGASHHAREGAGLSAFGPDVSRTKGRHK